MNSDSVASGATAAQPSAPAACPAASPTLTSARAGSTRISTPAGSPAASPTTSSAGAPCATGCAGRYHRRLHQCLAADGVESGAVRPDCARRFAEALGLLVKTGRVDANVLARYGHLEGLEATAPLDPALAQLQDLVLRRRRFVDECASLGRLEQELESKAALRQLCQALKRRVKAPDKDLLRAIEADDGLRRRTAGALLGVAPCGRGGGSQEGRRHVRGGRANPRNALYMAALIAVRRNPPLAAFYKRLRDRGK